MTTRLPDLTELAAADVAQDDLLLIRDVSANIDRRAEFGSIVERGSNANGEYVRFADGTQICWVLLSTSVVSADPGTDVELALPAAFPGMACVIGQFSAATSTFTNDRSLLVRNNEQSPRTTARFIAGTSLSNSYILYVAIGRWK